MRRRWGKRGLEDKFPFTIWEIIVIFMMIIALTISVRALANNTTYWKKYHSADLSLMTDLILTNQGDFKINYNLKEIRPNIVTKTLRIQPLIFQIYLKEDSFFIYDESSEKDRFPQSFIFGRDPLRNIVDVGNITGDYITLQKQGKILTINDNYVTSDSCPSELTKADTATKHFEAVALSSDANDYVAQLEAAFKRYPGSEQEMKIFVMIDPIKPSTLYYKMDQGIKGRKMSCLIKKHTLANKPDMTIIETPYSGEFDTDVTFTNNINNQANPYNYWIIIQIKAGDIDQPQLSEIIVKAIDEYYD